MTKKERWKKIEWALTDARDLLPERCHVGSFYEYLNHNELELAWQELRAAGKERFKEFRSKMNEAGKLMGLKKRA